MAALKRISEALPIGCAVLALLAGTPSAWAQSGPPASGDPAATSAAAGDTQEQPAEDLPADEAASDADEGEEPGTDILSGRTLSILLDGRAVLVDGHTSFVDGGLGKTRFDGDSTGGLRPLVVPVEADLIWTPRFTRTISGNVSGAWQLDQENEFDLLEAFLTYLPERSGGITFSAKAGLYWPEISLEHATGGAWSTVYTITPSAINAWVGEEVKVIGAEATITATLGQHDFSATGAVFGYDDTSGTLLSFRGWALHDLKATAFGHIPLPPLNSFIVHLQEDQTRSLIEIDDRVGYYGRFEWRPPWPFTVNVFYYDNRGDPRAFTTVGQWGWRTRFWNIGVTADLAPGTRLLAQAMTGSTKMGFNTRGVIWVDTDFSSAFLLLTHDITDAVAITGRAEAFKTREHGSQMSPDESEDGWALTAAGRWSLTGNLTAFLELLYVESERGVRANLGIPPKEGQTVAQLALRWRL